MLSIGTAAVFVFVVLLLSFGAYAKPGGGDVPGWLLVRVAKEKNLKWNPERKRWEKVKENAN